MGNSLDKIARSLKDNNKRVQLVYAFNGVGKTRLSKKFNQIFSSENNAENQSKIFQEKSLYYNAFTEDLFYWDNIKPELKIQSNSFTNKLLGLLIAWGEDRNITENFQSLTNNKLTPKFSEDFKKITFSFEGGNYQNANQLKISKGEESSFIWSIFFTFLKGILGDFNEDYPNLEYVFIDDPVSSLDENNLIGLAMRLADLIKKSNNKIHFIITTHNPLFYNVLCNEFRCKSSNTDYRPNSFNKMLLEKLDDGTFLLKDQKNDSPFSYHLYLKSEIQRALESDQIRKYHFNFIRNVLEKTSIFLGNESWKDLLYKLYDDENDKNRIARIINISSHSDYAGYEVAELNNNDKNLLRELVEKINKKYHFR